MRDVDSMSRIEIIADFEKYCEYILPNVLRERIRPFHRVIMRAIDDAINGRGPRRLIITMPPRHWKTLIGRNCFMTYMFGRYPDMNGIYACYNEDFAGGAKSEVSKILSSDEYKWLFPDARTRSTIDDIEDIDRSVRKTKKDTSRKISSVNSAGMQTFVGRGNALTGIGGHYLVADDLYKDMEEAQSIKVSEGIWNWFTRVFQTRRDHVKGGAIELVFYTRWMSDDVIGRMIAFNDSNTDPNYQSFKVLRFAAERDEDEGEESTYDPRAIGESLDPAFVSEYARAKKNPEEWMAMYQQKPLDVKGLLFETALMGVYTYPMKWQYVVITVDATFGENAQTTDRCGIEVWARVDNKYWLIEFVNKKLSYPDLRTVVKNLALKYENYWAIVIEEAANGCALIDDMRLVFPRVIGVKPQGKSKRERAQMILPVYQGGQIMIPSTDLCPNISEFVIELARFSGTQKNEKDDLVDAMVMAITYFEQFGFMLGATLVDAIPRGGVSYPNRIQGDNQWQNGRGIGRLR